VKIFALLIAGLLLSGEAFSQQTIYIRDMLYVPLRSGQGTQFRIVHKGLVSGTPLTVLEVSKDNTYTKIRTPKGIEGWVQSQYLSKEPSARNQLKLAKVSIASLQSDNDALSKKLSSLHSKDKSTTKQFNTTVSKNEKLEKELQRIKGISAKAIHLDSDNQRLLNDNQKLKNELDVVSADNQRLNDEKSSDSFMNGAFAVLIGVMITLMVPRLWPKKSSEWN
jgi:SH3 domain protein